MIGRGGGRCFLIGWRDLFDRDGLSLPKMCEDRTIIFHSSFDISQLSFSRLIEVR